ncbi:hypothetical protein [Candidatus Harpocratesius sp.]
MTSSIAESTTGGISLAIHKVFNQKGINFEPMKSAELSKFINDLDKNFEY